MKHYLYKMLGYTVKVFEIIFLFLAALFEMAGERCRECVDHCEQMTGKI